MIKSNLKKNKTEIKNVSWEEALAEFQNMARYLFCYGLDAGANEAEATARLINAVTAGVLKCVTVPKAEPKYTGHFRPIPGEDLRKLFNDISNGNVDSMTVSDPGKSMTFTGTFTCEDDFDKKVREAIGTEEERRNAKT